MSLPILTVSLLGRQIKINKNGCHPSNCSFENKTHCYYSIKQMFPDFECPVFGSPLYVKNLKSTFSLPFLSWNTRSWTERATKVSEMKKPKFTENFPSEISTSKTTKRSIRVAAKSRKNKFRLDHFVLKIFAFTNNEIMVSYGNL